MFSYDNIGGKIKTFAQAIGLIEAIGCIIAGFVLLGLQLPLIGFLVLILGPIVAWISSWFLYGYGQLIENSDIIAQEHKRVNEKHEKAVAKRVATQQAQRRETVKATIADPDINNLVFIDITCPHCDFSLSFPKGHLQNVEQVTCPMCDATISL